MTGEFLDGLACGKLLLPRCRSCDTWSEPQTLTCPGCGGTDLAWTPADPHAQVVSWAVQHPRRPSDGIEPTVLVIAGLAAGPWIWSRVIGATAADVTIGTPLVLVGATQPTGATLPVFRLDV